MTDRTTTLGTAARTASDIAGELRREFGTAMADRFGTQPQQDPVLATLFHALAVQIAQVYAEAEYAFPAAVFDDLVSGLGMPPRVAQPAQVVAGFSDIQQREPLTAETTLIGYNRTGEAIPFTPDVAIQLAPTELAFAGVYEGGRLHVLPGATLPGEGAPIPPGHVPVPGFGAAAPTVFLAFRTDAAHLSGLGLFIELFPPDGPVAEALRRSPWQLLGEAGTVSEESILRVSRGRGGVQRLGWFHGQASSGPQPGAFPLAEGAFGPQVWVFPEIPADRRHRCAIPAALAESVRMLLPEEHREALDAPLAWVQIPMPAGVSGVSNAIQRVAVNCVTASNVEVFSEQVVFGRMGTVVRFEPEGSRERYVLGVRSVIGESGTHYVAESDVDSALPHARYRFRDARFEIRPARTENGRFDAYAVVRLLVSDGDRANGLQAGDLRRIDASLANVTAQVSNLTLSRGGGAPPEYGAAKVRFAELLRTRERVVTVADIDIACRVFEPRIQDVRVESGTEVRDGVPQRVETVAVLVSRADFADPGAELPRMRELLEADLQSRAVLGQNIRVLLDDGRGAR
ncbi:hypothetical protein [Longimicrobium terrae]|uniref:Baseplate protein J-like domain-containing protein n=1 Tax=Longimicrobium terrae TaxID=1639882 RepID=A0A841H327_9BACT|nr:hypothetical protein [Longimicrobium terrae]MBB4637819.1 hypothetical protein [Longimicrobium terrae]MBB6072326.1 hypothetical protein [Longimicrobium terrae]NNC31246.1 hypothetical protein [Longimicrobium terrae]